MVATLGVDVKDVLRELESLGTEQNRKIYKRHGTGDKLYGVSYANLNALTKKIKTNHELAQSLWASGYYEARVLATMVADPKQMTGDLAEAWVSDLTEYGATDALSGLVGKTDFVQSKADKWTQSDEEWRGALGWQLVGYLALKNKDLPDDYFEKYLKVIERDIHSRKNRVRYSMNTTLICIGMRNDQLQKKALDVAKNIGEVHVDHGETGCKTPDATAYIHKVNARKKGG